MRQHRTEAHEEEWKWLDEMQINKANKTHMEQ